MRRLYLLSASRWRKKWRYPSMLFLAVMVAVVARVAVFLYTAVSPLKNEGGALVSPTEMQRGIDIEFYLGSKAYYGQLADNLKRSYQGLLGDGERSRFYLSGPVFPLLLALFGYGQDETLPLAVFFLLMSCALAGGWLFWLRRQGFGPLWLFLFAMVPNAIWYTINISTDLPFALTFAAFFLSISLHYR